MTNSNDTKTPKIAISARDLTVTFSDGTETIRALNGVSLQFEHGSMTAIMGPSGSGKSTLLKVLGGLIHPGRGSVNVNGTELTRLRAKDLARIRRRACSFVFQQFNLVDDLTVRENVTLPLELDGVRYSEAVRHADRALAAVGATAIAQRRASDLSGGQAQRVAIARALAVPGNIILADEPTAALDSVTSEEIMGLLRERVDAGATCVLVTHDARNAGWADEIIYLRDGQIVQPRTNRASQQDWPNQQDWRLEQERRR